MCVSNGHDARLVKVGQRPWNMALTPDGSKLYVTNQLAGEMRVGELPWGVAMAGRR